MNNNTVNLATLCPSLIRTDIKTMTIQDIQKEVDEICAWFDMMWPFDKSLVAKKIPVSWMEKDKKAVGQASRRRVNGVYKYSIVFGKTYMQNATVTGFHSTILHEVLHCIENGNRDGWSHTGLWKERAAIISRITPYQISRCVQASEITPEYQKIQMAKKRYAIACEDCDYTANYQRKGKIFQYVEKGNAYGFYMCPKCGSAHLKAKYLY